MLSGMYVVSCGTAYKVICFKIELLGILFLTLTTPVPNNITMSKAKNKPPGCDRKKNKRKRPTADLGVVKNIATLNV